MSLAPAHDRLRIPESLQIQLGDFRRRLRSIKLLEAGLAAAFVVAVAFLAVFAVDRLVDAPRWARAAGFAATLLGLAAIPTALYRWVWRSRRLDQLARILTRTQPRVGDRLLGVIELAESDAEQARSHRLCEAAMIQVAEDSAHLEFRGFVPNPRHRTWAAVAALPLAATLGLFALAPAAATNAMARLLNPWGSTPRYTFAALVPPPTRLVVPHGEPFPVTLALAEGTAWHPVDGSARLGDQSPVVARLRDGRYEFTFPAQIAPSPLEIRIGDARHRVEVEPTHRPELTSVVADVTLPDYLGRPGSSSKDVRGGTIALVKGSHARFTATANRDLASATVDGSPRTPSGSTVSGPPVEVDGAKTVEFRWKDALGLEGKAPFALAVAGTDDEPPTLSVEDLPRARVVLDSETLPFKVKARDDFGVKQVGIEWLGVEDPAVKSPAQGEKVLAAGGHDKELLDVRGTFTAKALGIEPQPIRLRVYAEDYRPGRARAYSPVYTLFVLDPAQHAIWLTEQLSKWQRQSLEVRDREMQLHETNKQLRALAADELDQPDARRKVETQATAERANGRRLTNLVANGEELVKQATRNPEFGVGHLEKWAEMLQVLKDISGNRMPSVADLLKEASQGQMAMASAGKPSSGQSPTQAGAKPKMSGQPKAGPPSQSKTQSPPMAGEVRESGGGKPAEVREPKTPLPVQPTVVDRESQQQPPPEDDGKSAGKKNPSSPGLKLAVTTLAGKPDPNAKPTDPPEAVAQAVEEQRDLLAEFDKVSDELNKVLGNLEGSTLVKRLKAESRAQLKIAGKLGDQLGDTFGVYPQVGKPATEALGALANQEAKGSQTVSVIMDDLESYFERRKFAQFKATLDDMRKQDVVGALRLLGDDLRRESGLSITQAEYWSDTLDRWAEDLVDSASCGNCPGGKTEASLPPSVVLEVLQILEGEINLREETRVADQARPALSAADHGVQAVKLAGSQGSLRDRIAKVGERIKGLKHAEKHFGKEIALMAQVEGVMREAVTILARPETGKEAIAAETEAIELLLKSKRINPKGGGGGGSSPGGGSGGTTQDSALALLGRGANEKEVREDRGVAQSTGESGPSLPEEYRSGLDQYFNKLEGRPGNR